MQQSFRYAWYVLGALTCVALAVLYALLSRTEQDLRVVFLNVGQGDAIFIEVPNGNQVLIDGGPDSRVLTELKSVMPFFDRSIDVVVATHPDKDHIGGLVSVLNRYHVDYFLTTETKSDTDAFSALLGAQHEVREDVVYARRGMTINLGGGAYLLVLYPDRDTSAMESNTASIVLQLRYEEASFVFTGDAPLSVEQYLVALDGGALQSDVIKLGHHGSRTSSVEAFLRSVAPEFAVVSAGRGNSYGHPHREVISRVSELGAVILNTAEDGRVTFFSDGEEVDVKKR